MTKDSTSKMRADQLMVASGCAESESEAGALIMAGRVLATDAKGREHRVEKAGESLHRASTFRVKGKPHPYVSRGGVKLAHALDAFDVDPAGLLCADIGVSTGGFTDCLLQRGAAHVHAVEVGHNQTAWKIRTDARVTLYERQHAGKLEPDHFGARVQLMTIDVSFIGLARLWAHLEPLLAEHGRIVALVKPQFELPKGDIGEGGIVRSPELREKAIERAVDAAREAGLRLCAQSESPIHGADGNVEFLILLDREA